MSCVFFIIVVISPLYSQSSGAGDIVSWTGIRDMPDDYYLSAGIECGTSGLFGAPYFFNPYYSADIYSFHPFAVNITHRLLRFAEFLRESSGPMNSAGPDPGFYSYLKAGMEWSFFSDNQLSEKTIIVSSKRYGDMTSSLFFSVPITNYRDIAVRTGYVHRIGDWGPMVEVYETLPWVNPVNISSNTEFHGIYIGASYLVRKHLSLFYTVGSTGVPANYNSAKSTKHSLDFFWYPAADLNSEGYLKVSVPIGVEYCFNLYSIMSKHLGIGFDAAIGAGPFVSGLEPWKIDFERNRSLETYNVYLSLGVSVIFAGFHKEPGMD